MGDSNILYEVATWLVPLVIAIVFHEVAHGLAARALGDTTAAERGRLTLNPIKHMDPVGTVALPLVLAVANAPIFGWAKPVPVRSDRLRNPRVHMMLVALAGPGMNFALALVAVLGIGAIVAAAGTPLAGTAGFIADNLFNFVLINVFLGIFNLLPIPPFDGGHVVEGLLPRPLARRYARLGRFGLPILILLLVLLPMVAPDANIVARVVAPIVEAVIRALLALVGIGV